MSWWLPGPEIIPKGGRIRVVGKHDRAAYHRAYYHAKRKGTYKQTRTATQKARRLKQYMARYHADLTRARANGRANYWRSLARKTTKGETVHGR